MKSKLWIIIVLVIIAVVISAVYYVRQPAVDLGPITIHHKAELKPASPGADINGWQIYSNSQYGFEFKYPDSVSVNDEVTNSEFGAYADLKNKNPDLESEPLFYVDVVPASEINIDTWFSDEFKDRDASLMPTKSVKTIGGQRALAIDDPVTEGGCSGYYYIILRNGYRYRISDASCQSDSTAAKILSTFTFIK